MSLVAKLWHRETNGDRAPEFQVTDNIALL